MNTALQVFSALIKHTEIAKGLYYFLDEQKVPIDSSDLLRWQWVLSVSALDKYVHDVVRIGMVQQYLGLRTITDKYNAFRIDMRNHLVIKTSPTPEIEFEKEIIRQHNYLAFQSPDKISDALSFIWSEKHKWDVISTKMSTTISAKDLKTKLNNIVIRRNQIVHEGDCISSIIPLQKQIINKTDVDDVISFITDLVTAIHGLIK